MSLPIDQEQLTEAHVGATVIIIQQLRYEPNFDEAQEKQLVGLMSRHMHLMLAALKAAALSAGVRDLAARPKGERQEQPQEERP